VNAIVAGSKEELCSLNTLNWTRPVLKELSPLVLSEVITRGFLSPPGGDIIRMAECWF
jgi:hypothetical protein